MTHLGDLGLSSYEEKAYRALATLGSGTAREVSDASGVPMGRVYDVLNALDARDLVRAETSAEPTRYAAVDPDVAVDRLLRERKRELDARAERYESIADAAASELAAARPTESRFWSAPVGSDAAETLVRELFQTAEGTVRSALGRPYEDAAWDRYAAEMETFRDCTARDLTVEALVTPAVLQGVPADARRRYADARDGFDVRVTTDLPVTFDVVDDDRFCVTIPHPLDSAERLGVIDVANASVAGRLADLFREAWAEATPLDAVVESGVGTSE